MNNEKKETDWESVYNEYDKKYSYIPKLINQVKDERTNNPENYTKKKIYEMSRKSYKEIKEGKIKGYSLEDKVEN